MKVQIEIPDTTKGLCVNYVYYVDGYEGDLRMESRGYNGKGLDAIEVKEDDVK